MLIEQNHYPLGGGVPWGTIFIVIAVVGCVSYATYQVMKPIEPISSPKNKNDERG